MKPELEQKLVQTHPKLYADRHSDPRHSPLAFGIECGDGWFDLLWDLSQKLERLIEAVPVVCQFCGHSQTECSCEEYHPYWPRASQVKEKFGTLRFYTWGFANGMEKLIKEAERESAKTCEECGAPGKLRTERWHAVRCDACDSHWRLDVRQ